MRKQNPIHTWTIQLFVPILLGFLLCLSRSLVSAQQESEIILAPSSTQVNVGEAFTVTLSITPTEAISGWSLDFRFNQDLLHATNVTPGTNWITFFNQGEINNLNGTIAAIQTWSTGPFPTTNHTLCIIRLQAMHAGVCHLSIEHVQVSNTSFQTIPVSSKNTTVTILETSGGNGSQGSNEEPPGYLMDTNQDGTYDTFHNNETGTNMTVQKHDNCYLIDSNGDGIWDHLYDPQTKEMTQYHPPSQGGQQKNTWFFIFAGILGVVLFLFVILLLLTRKKKIS